VNKLTEINALTDLVGVLLVASANAEHGRVSHDLVVDPLLGGRDLQAARGETKPTPSVEKIQRDTRGSLGTMRPLDSTT